MSKFNMMALIEQNMKLDSSVHEVKAYDHICLFENCPDRLLSEADIPHHNKIHAGFIQNIHEYLSILAKSFEKKQNGGLFNKIRSLIESQGEILASFEQKYEDKQRDILDIFDEMKWDLSDILDVAYQKCCSSLQIYHQRKTKDVRKKLNILNTMLRVQNCIEERAFPKDLNETEINDLAELFSTFRTRVNTFSVDLAEKFKMLNEMINDDSKISLNLDLKRIENIQAKISKFIKDQFGIVDEVELAPSPYLNHPVTPYEKSGVTHIEDGICALVTLKDSLIATAGKDSKIKLWDLNTGECEGELSGHQDTVWDLKAAFDSQYIFSASADSTIRGWKVGDKKQKMLLKGHESAVYAIEFEDSIKTLISGDQNGVLLLWDLNQSKVSKKLEGHDKAILSIRKLNESKFVTGSEDQAIKVWDFNTGELIKTIIGHESRIYDLSVFKKGKRFASCDNDGMVYIWDTEKGSIIEKFKAHEKGIRSIAVNETGTLLASGGYDSIFRVWDLETLCLLKENSNNDAVIRCIRFLDDTALLYCDNNVKNYKSSKLPRRLKKPSLEEIRKDNFTQSRVINKTNLPYC